MEKDRSNMGVVQRLAAAGVNMVNKPVFKGGSDVMTRSDAEEFLQAAGARVTKSVSAKTDYLIVGDKPSASKVAKAKKLGVTIITEDELIEMFNERMEANG